jgi:cellobiose transport system permease protein
MAVTTTTVAKAAQHQEATQRKPINYWPYLFISPFFILFAIFGLFPYGYAFVLSFIRWDGLSPTQWVGFSNYTQLFQDDLWWKSVVNTIWLMVVTLINLVIALGLAFLLHSGLIRFKEAYRTAFFTPVIASSVAIAIVFNTIFGLKYGALNYGLSLLGIGPIDWLQSPDWLKPAIALVVIWRYFGFNTVIYLAGLAAIPTELYDAARVDGASWRTIFFRITIPLLQPVITFTVILSIIGGMKIFEEPLLLGGGAFAFSPGGTDQAGLTIMVNLYNTAFKYLQFGYAAAMAVVTFLIIACFSFVYYRTLGQSSVD